MQTNDHAGYSVDRVPSATPVPEDVLRRRRALGVRIRLAREAANLSQERLGEMAGLTRVSVSHIETGAHALVVDRLWLIADAVGVPASDLIRE
jgi:DNA-binding XRE family transcriptional regulator